MTTRVLFLDDSGKPDAGHASGAVVIAGFAVDARDYPTLSRRVLGAKGAYYRRRGVPQTWELKSSDFVKPNPWKRAQNRNFVYELARLLRSVNGTTYAAAIVKSRMKHAMALSTTMPLQLQCLVEHFEAECRTLGVSGMIVADWSSHQRDQHASQCVASFVASRRLAIHPSVYYASSHTNEGIQVADLIAAVRRRTLEGDVQLGVLDEHLAGIRATQDVERTVKNRVYCNYITVF